MGLVGLFVKILNAGGGIKPYVNRETVIIAVFLFVRFKIKGL